MQGDAIMAAAERAAGAVMDVKYWVEVRNIGPRLWTAARTGAHGDPALDLQPIYAMLNYLGEKRHNSDLRKGWDHWAERRISHDAG